MIKSQKLSQQFDAVLLVYCCIEVSSVPTLYALICTVSIGKHTHKSERLNVMEHYCYQVHFI